MAGRVRAALRTAALVSVTALVAGCGLLGDGKLGELVRFTQLNNDSGPRAVELAPGQEPIEVGLGSVEADALPPLEDRTRRFAFIDVGCKQDSAQLVVQDDVLESQLLENGKAEDQTMCAVPVYFLSVFDVPTDDLPDPVRLP